jgi:hypothetical protein
MSSGILNTICNISSFSADETAILKYSRTEFRAGRTSLSTQVSMGQYQPCKTLNNQGAARESDINVQDLSARLFPVMVKMGKHIL